ncbi:MAG: hypothetical protein IIT43_07145, partial [Clostridia bacterium]|nr:hypothetical protein [Clostridia bacterium]
GLFREVLSGFPTNEHEARGVFSERFCAGGKECPSFQALAWYGMASKNGRKNGTDHESPKAPFIF